MFDEPGQGNGAGAPSHTYPQGVELFRQGHALQEVFAIVSGTVKLTHLNSKGGEVIVNLAFPEEWLGTAAVIASKPSPVSAVTCSAVSLRQWPAATFRRLLVEDPLLSRQVQEAHSLELCRQACRIGHLCSLTSRERLEAVLSRFAATARRRPDATVRLQMPLKQWELAEFVGITPEHLSRLLKAMERDGTIRREKGWIGITDPATLSAG